MTQYSFLTEFAALNQGIGHAFNYAGKATKLAANNPKIAGAIGGTAIGAATGLKRDENGETHILRNAAIGAGVGTAGGAAGAHFLKGRSGQVQGWLGKKAGKFYGKAAAQRAANAQQATTTALTKV